jgi:glycosyltransferase involved in cell wall biosynthesis
LLGSFWYVANMKIEIRNGLFEETNGISVIIVCFNSVSRLLPTLQHLANQELPEGFRWEIVLVDNASTDGTTEDAQNIWLSLNQLAPLRIIYEGRQGTDHARRTGIFNANFPVFIFCDDDNWLQADYLQIGYSFLMENPEVGLVGGESLLAPCGPVPDWFKHVQSYYAVGKIADGTCDMTHYGLWGAGLMGLTHVMRKALPEQIPLLNAGRVGNSAGFGEDGEMCMRVILQGYRLVFLEQLKLWHCISPNRLTLQYRDALIRGNQHPVEVMGSYFRLLGFLKKNRALKVITGVYHYIKWWVYKVKKSKPDEIKFSRDYLYYLLGGNQFETEDNVIIKKYWQYAVSKKNE